MIVKLLKNQNKMREQQTSVEWQFEQLFNSFEKFNNGEYTFAQYLSYNLTIFEQAKEMHKQEIIEATLYGWRRSTEVNSMDPNEFYNKTFKSK
jgi:uncharacterized protein Yka (UPF0111/DUF47 family)